jgi:hypothetical protein
MIGRGDTLRAHLRRRAPGRHHMNVRPLRDRILVERLEESEQRIGGIIIPDTAREKPR